MDMNMRIKSIITPELLGKALFVIDNSAKTERAKRDVFLAQKKTQLANQASAASCELCRIKNAAIDALCMEGLLKYKGYHVQRFWDGGEQPLICVAGCGQAFHCIPTQEEEDGLESSDFLGYVDGLTLPSTSASEMSVDEAIRLLQLYFGEEL